MPTAITALKSGLKEAILESVNQFDFEAKITRGIWDHEIIAMERESDPSFEGLLNLAAKAGFNVQYVTTNKSWGIKIIKP